MLLGGGPSRDRPCLRPSSEPRFAPTRGTSARRSRGGCSATSTRSSKPWSHFLEEALASSGEPHRSRPSSSRPPLAHGGGWLPHHLSHTRQREPGHRGRHSTAHRDVSPRRLSTKSRSRVHHSLARRLAVVESFRSKSSIRLSIAARIVSRAWPGGKSSSEALRSFSSAISWRLPSGFHASPIASYTR
jgi:hypothetical protein